MAELLFKDEVYAIIGAAMEVYNQLGPGFGEAIYQDAMEIEVEIRKIPNKRPESSHLRGLRASTSPNPLTMISEDQCGLVDEKF